MKTFAAVVFVILASVVLGIFGFVGSMLVAGGIALLTAKPRTQPTPTYDAVSQARIEAVFLAVPINDWRLKVDGLNPDGSDWVATNRTCDLVIDYLGFCVRREGKALAEGLGFATPAMNALRKPLQVRFAAEQAARRALRVDTMEATLKKLEAMGR
jgi:hypothetical protein